MSKPGLAKRVAGIGCLSILVLLFLGYVALVRRPRPEVAPAPATAPEH